MTILRVPAQVPVTWDLLWAGSWEENKTLHNRGDFRAGWAKAGLAARAQAIDKRPLNFELDPPWGDSTRGNTAFSAGLYHKATGSRLLYGTLDEWGLPARIRRPWVRSAPYMENHQPLMADMKTTASSSKAPEAYLYLSSPFLTLFPGGVLPEMALRGFASAQITPGEELTPAFSGGLETRMNHKTGLLLECFYTGAELPPKSGDSWFSDPPPLPARDFRLGAAALAIHSPYISLSSDWAWSETFAFGTGIYGNAGLRLEPPLRMNGNKQPGPWSLSLAADGMSARYVGRDGTSPGGGLRTAGKIEWKGARGSLFRANTTLRASAPDAAFDRSSTGLYFRFPAPAAADAGRKFPLRVSRISLNAARNAANRNKIQDGIDGGISLSLALPPMVLPKILAQASAYNAKTKTVRPKRYPLNINLSAALNGLTVVDADTVPSPYPLPMPGGTFESAKAGGELLWSPGIVQLRTRWVYTAYAEKDDQWEASFSTAVRFKHGRFSIKAASPDFPTEWNCTVSWRVEK